MNLSNITDIAVSGLVAQRARMAATASNVANAQTTRTASGDVYRRRDPVFRTDSIGGPFAGELVRSIQRVRVERVAVDPRPPIARFDPGHPDADERGYVRLPRVNLVEELANMTSASRSYESNLVIMRKVREMAQAAMQIGR